MLPASQPDPKPSTVIHEPIIASPVAHLMQLTSDHLFLQPWVGMFSHWDEHDGPVRIGDISHWFEVQKYDFRLKYQETATSVNVRWGGHGGFATYDYRFRHCAIEWVQGPGAVPELVKENANAARLPVARAWFQQVPIAPEATHVTMEILVEVHAHDLQHARIFRMREHSNVGGENDIPMHRRIMGPTEGYVSQVIPAYWAKISSGQYIGGVGRKPQTVDPYFPMFRRPTSSSYNTVGMMYTKASQMHALLRAPQVSSYLFRPMSLNEPFCHVIDRGGDKQLECIASDKCVALAVKRLLPDIRVISCVFHVFRSTNVRIPAATIDSVFSFTKAHL